MVDPQNISVILATAATVLETGYVSDAEMLALPLADAPLMWHQYPHIRDILLMLADTYERIDRPDTAEIYYQKAARVEASAEEASSSTAWPNASSWNQSSLMSATAVFIGLCVLVALVLVYYVVGAKVSTRNFRGVCVTFFFLFLTTSLSPPQSPPLGAAR